MASMGTPRLVVAKILNHVELRALEDPPTIDRW